MLTLVMRILSMQSQVTDEENIQEYENSVDDRDGAIAGFFYSRL